MVNNDRSEKVQSIAQGECTDCERSDGNYTVTNFEQSGSNLKYHIRCTCGTETDISITPDGINSSSKINYEDATWNYQNESESEEEENQEEVEQGQKSPL
jgi:hypothetical protein